MRLVKSSVQKIESILRYASSLLLFDFPWSKEYSITVIVVLAKQVNTAARWAFGPDSI
jgi:hypothetical protein